MLMFIPLFLFSFLTSLLGAWLAIKFSDKLGIDDIPNHRSSHATIIPKGGGVGISTAFALACITLSMPVSLWLPSVVISLTGFWGGDKHRLSVAQRLIIQFGCSIIFLAFFLNSKQVSMATYFLCIPLSVFIVGTSNFYNFMDGIDGIAGVTAVVGFLLLLFYSSGSAAINTYGVLCLVMVFSSLGFLCFNIFKAKVFLGDVGSILLGFVFACLVVILSDNYVDFLVMVGCLAPFYYDELFTILVRIKHGDSLVVPHRKHIYQLLANELGISHWKISVTYGLVQMMTGLSIIFIKPKGIIYILLIYLIYTLIFAVISILIRKKVSNR